MALDINGVIHKLVEFYNPKGRLLLHVGVGGGAMLAYSSLAKYIVAVDNDARVKDSLKSKLSENKMEGKTQLLIQDFYSIKPKEKFDTVFFEFCLHEMENSARAIEYAKNIAENVVIIDHVPESKWSWYCCETDKIERSWKSMSKLDFVKKKDLCVLQTYSSYDELKNKLSVLGDEAISRIEELKNVENINIEMPYRLALI